MLQPTSTQRRPAPSAYLALLPAARRVLTENAALQGKSYAQVELERAPDLAYGLALFATHGAADGWQQQACMFPSGVVAAPSTMFGLYDLSDERLLEETRLAS